MARIDSHYTVTIPGNTYEHTKIPGDQPINQRFYIRENIHTCLRTVEMITGESGNVKLTKSIPC